MAFYVVIDLVPPQESDLIVGNVHVIGEPDKPSVSTLPGFSQELAGKLHACHIIAWKIICLGIRQQMTEVPLRLASMRVAGLSEYQAQNVSASQIKEFLEANIKARLKELQERVTNYYAGPGRQNMSAGGKMGNAIQELNNLYDQYQRSQFGSQKILPMQYQTAAVDKQIALFRAAYDESPFHSEAEKVLARGEYVAFWYQTYYGGDPDSTRYAKFLIETLPGQQAIDRLINEGK